MRKFVLLLFFIASQVSGYSQTVLPDNMYGDTAFAPFYWGVASGDPLPDGVVIWAKVAAILTPVIQTQTWEVSTDSNFANILETGSVDALSTNDNCVRVEVSGLQPNTYYYYRFTDSQSGNISQVGRTKTAPIGSVDEMTLAVASCSSIYSGYFNAYRNIANNDEVDLMIHLGDYIYNFVDNDEQVRIPEPYPADPDNLQEWRDRHAYYLLDPDLRLARQMHPWVVIWDNHDFGDGTEGGVEAFWEYVPRRDYHNDIQKIHRSYSYGNLIDLIMIDIEKYRNVDEIIPGEPSVLSNEQRSWFLNELSVSDAKWRIIGNQKMFSGWYSIGVPPGIGIPTDGDVFDAGSWDGFMVERDTILTHIIDNEIENVMVISGDVHMSFCMDIALDPLDAQVYAGDTGEGAIGVEFTPTSVSRGNFDEAGVSQAIAESLATASGNINPHHQFTNFIDHGYGLLHINQDTIRAEIRYCDKLQITDEETIGVEMLMLDGENHWHRSSSVNSVAELNSTNPISLFPNPTNETLNVLFNQHSKYDYTIAVLDAQGRVVLSAKSIGQKEIVLGVSSLIPGAYVVQASNDEKLFKKSFIISR
ncbi:MAG: alkaline phosphatase D [Bacteroidia bacterium]|jgi:alkaline phosphatase D